MEQDKIITTLVEDIAKYCEPVKIILFSSKTDIAGRLRSFKLCIIVRDVESVAELEGNLYLNTDCPIPFDILIYNLSEWEELVHDEASFAGRVNSSGVVLYG